MYLILNAIHPYTIQLRIHPLIYHILIFNYLLVLPLVLIPQLQLLPIQTLMLPPPTTHPQSRQQLPPVVPPLRVETVTVQRTEHLPVWWHHLLQRTLHRIFVLPRLNQLERVTTETVLGVVRLDHSRALQVEILVLGVGTWRGWTMSSWGSAD